MRRTIEFKFGNFTGSGTRDALTAWAQATTLLRHGTGTMVESRRQARQRVLKAGTIEFSGGAIDCTVRNLSATGAALDVVSQTGVPEKFTLVLPGDGLHMPCHIVWRKAYRIGIAFD
jgi:hypothetical protein